MKLNILRRQTGQSIPTSTPITRGLIHHQLHFDPILERIIPHNTFFSQSSGDGSLGLHFSFHTVSPHAAFKE